MIAGKAAGLIDDLANHAKNSAFIDGKPCLPDAQTHRSIRL